MSRGIALTGNGQPMANMGIAVGDYDGDGLTDVFVTHLGNETHTLWRQAPVGFFRDRTQDSRVARTEVAGDRVRGGGGRLRPGRVAGHRLRERQGVPRRRSCPGPVTCPSSGGCTPSGTSCSGTPASGKFEDVSEANPVFCGHAERRPRAGASATSTTTAGRTCWSCRSATAPGCTGTSRPAGTGSGCARPTRATADRDALRDDGRAGDRRRANLDAGGAAGPQLPVQQRPAAVVRAGGRHDLRSDRGDVAGRHPGAVARRPGRPVGRGSARAGGPAREPTISAGRRPVGRGGRRVRRAQVHRARGPDGAEPPPRSRPSHRPADPEGDRGQAGSGAGRPAKRHRLGRTGHGVRRPRAVGRSRRRVTGGRWNWPRPTPGGRSCSPSS